MPASAPPALGPDELRRFLFDACAGASGLVVAIGADRYAEAPGPARMLIADEERSFTGERAVYLHLSPLDPSPLLAPNAPGPVWLVITLDGAARFTASAGTVALALRLLLSGPAGALPRLFVVHALAGHRPESLAAIARALQPRHAVFWLHDFAVLCANPALLRNDIAFCHAPPTGSIACRVCAYGPPRAAHVARARALFAAVSFDVVAPSEAALALFRAAAPDLPARSARAHPPLRLAPAGAAAPSPGSGPPRVAFVGPATRRNGWPRFQALVEAAPDAAFYLHFGDRADLAGFDGVTPVLAERSPARPFAMARALAERRVDLLVAAAPWPDPAAQAAYEALAAGADLLALADSGHAAELAAASEGSLVFGDIAALIAFVAGGEAAARARARRAAPRPRLALRHGGATATLGLGCSGAAAIGRPDPHLLLRGARLDGAETAGVWRFALPPGDAARVARLRSRVTRGVWERDDESDRRRLGVAVASLRLDGAPVPPGDPRRVSGWHAPERGSQWTDGDAVLRVGEARVLELTLSAEPPERET